MCSGSASPRGNASIFAGTLRDSPPPLLTQTQAVMIWSALESCAALPMAARRNSRRGRGRGQQLLGAEVDMARHGPGPAPGILGLGEGWTPRP